MFLYFFLVAFPLGMGLTRSSRPPKQYPGLWAYFVLAVLVCGLRFEVGTDWEGYYNIYEWVSKGTFGEAFAFSEPSYFVLNKLSASLEFGFAGVVFVGSLLFLYGSFVYARGTTNPWLAIAVITPYLVLVISMSGIRQSCAIGIGLLLFARWSRLSLISKLALIAFAATFHNSAVILLLFVLAEIKANLLVRLALSSLVAALLLFGLDSSSTIERYQVGYVSDNLVSEGAFFHVLLTAFPAVLYLRYEKRLAAQGLSNANVRLASILALIAMPLLLVSSTGIDRLSLYLSFVQMWTYPVLLSGRVMNTGTLKVATALMVLLIFFVYFLFGTHAYAFLPYRNLLFA